MRLTVTGLKSRSVDVDLAKLTVVSGRNGAGKTTLVAGLQILALGYLPTLGKRLVDLAPLLGERRATMTLHIDAQRVLTRIVERTDKGLTTRVHCSWLPETAKPADHAREALALFGGDEQEVAEALDIRELLNATPNQRAARIERLLASATSTDGLLDRLARLTLQRLVQIPDERMPTEWRALEGMLTAPQAEAVARTWPLVEAKLAATDLPATFGYVNERKREVALGRTRKQQAETELRQRLQDVPEADSSRLATLETERGQLDQRIGALTEQQRAAEQQATARTTAQAALDQADTERDRVARTRMDWIEERERTLDPAPQLRALQAELDALTAPTPPDDTAARQVEEQIRGTELLVEGLPLPAVPSLAAETRAVDCATRKLADLTESPWFAVATKAQGIVDACGTSKKDEKIKAAATEILALAAPQADPGVKPALEAELRAAQKALGAAEERQARAREAYGRVATERQAHLDHIDVLRARAAELRGDPTPYTAALAAFETERETLLRERAELERQRDARQARERTTSDALGKAEAARSEARARLEGLGAVVNLTETGAALTAARERHAAVVAEIDTLTTNATRRRELDTIVAELHALDAEREVLVALEAALQQARGDAVQAAGGPLLEGLTTYLRGAGRHEVPYIRAGKGQCDLGWTDAQKREVDITALSEAEWQFFTSGLAAAVQILREAPLRVLLVEAAGCDLGTLQQMLAGIGAVADGLSLALVCTPHVDGPSREAGGWSLVALGDAARAVAA